MNILIASNSGFIKHARIMLYSLCKTNPDVPINVWFAYHGLSDEDINSVKQVIGLFDNATLTPLDVGGDLATMVEAYGNFTIEIFYRILAIDLLPQDIDRILYLDVDMIVRGDLSGLYHTNIEGHPFAVCEDISSKLNGSDISIKSNIGFADSHKYFNSGVMLFNLDYLRTIDAGHTILTEIYDKYDKYPYPDQDVMNRLFSGESVWADWNLYNCHPGAYYLDNRNSDSGCRRFASYAQISAAASGQLSETFNTQYSDITPSIHDNAVIIHYVGASKPWRPDYPRDSVYFAMFAEDYDRFSSELENEFRQSILILKGPSRYEVLRVAADLTAGGLAQAGFNVTVMDLTADDFDLSTVLKSNWDIVFMPQASLYDIDLNDGTPLVAALPSLCVGWIFDDVIYHYKRVANNRFRNTALLSVDGSADRIAKSMGITSNTILPLLHGGFVAGHRWYVLQDEVLTYDKPIDVICPCTVGVQPTWHGPDNDVQYTLAQHAIDIWKSEPVLSPRQALTKTISSNLEWQSGQHLNNDRGVQNEFSFETVVYVTEMIRYLLKKQIIESVVNEGFNVYLIGDIAEKEKYPDNVTVCGAMNITDVTELIAKSKVLINPFPTLYEEGAHERIFTALINGAVCFTPGYPFLRNLLGERLEYIDPNDMPDALGRMWEIVNNYGTYLEPILDNAEYSLRNHTWEARGRELARMLT